MVRRFIQSSTIALLLVVLALGAVSAQESYEGLVTIGRFGRFPSGLFGASNLVPPNTLVRVRNVETGRSERVIITDGVTEPGVFLVLSPEAAQSLEIDPGGATRVRLTEVATGGATSIDPASERALSQDPDINPLAGVSLLDTLPPPQPVDGGPVDESAGEPSYRTETEPAPRLSEALASSGPEPAPETPMPAPEPVAETEPVADPLQPQPRTGVAAGIARTTVGQAQQEFERPDTTFPVARPDPVSVPAPQEPGEPRVAAEETAATGLPTAPPRPPARSAISDDRIVEPILPAVDPGNGALVRDDQVPPVATFEPEVETRPADDPVEFAGEPVEEGPIDTALRSLVDRLPRKDLYPSPVGESGEIGFRRTERPAERVAVVDLPEAEVPAVERPSLAGLAPLRAAPDDFAVELAIAAVPEDERPEVTALAVRPAPESEAVTAALPEAEAEAPAVVEEPPEGDVRGPEPSGLVRVSPVEEDILADRLAEAVPGREETAELSDLPSVVPGIPPELDAELAEAVPAAEERPDIAARPSITPAEERAIPDRLAREGIPEPVEETVGAVETAEAPLDRPTEIPEDAILALEPADFRPPETPEPDTESIIAREEATREAAPEGEVLAARVEPELEPEPAPAVAVRSEPEFESEPEPVDRGAPPAIGTLEVERYYLQIGAYSNASTAQVAVDALGATYPMAVLPADRAGRTIYRVLVGPLERDETGTLLLWLRARGYRDTFVREGSEL